MVADDDRPTEGQEEATGSNINGDQSEVKVVNESAASSLASTNNKIMQVYNNKVTMRQPEN